MKQTIDHLGTERWEWPNGWSVIRWPSGSWDIYGIGGYEVDVYADHDPPSMRVQRDDADGVATLIPLAVLRVALELVDRGTS